MAERRGISNIKRKKIGSETRIINFERDREFQAELTRLLNMLRAEYTRVAAVNQTRLNKDRQQYTEKYKAKTSLSDRDLAEAQRETEHMYEGVEESANIPATDAEIMQRVFATEGDNYQETLQRTGFKVLATDENFARLKQMFNISPTK